MTAVFKEKEGDLQLTVNNVQNARRFDDYVHGVPPMKAVDFIIDLPDRYLYIEFKDPQHPNSRDENRREFIQDFHSGRLDEELKYKYRGSFYTNGPVVELTSPSIIWCWWHWIL